LARLQDKPGGTFALVPASSQAAFHWYKCEHYETATHNRKDSGCTESTTTGNYELKRLPFGEVDKVPVIMSGAREGSVVMVARKVTTSGAEGGG
jgi:hypothetical protein